jgi:hypothetical protein
MILIGSWKSDAMHSSHADSAKEEGTSYLPSLRATCGHGCLENCYETVEGMQVPCF